MRWHGRRHPVDDNIYGACRVTEGCLRRTRQAICGARNRADDVTIHLALKDAGVTLVSATENIDETPSGMLLHGIMSSIAEFYSRNLATEVVKGLSQKAAQGGTVTKAPIGYRNVGIRDDMGREIRTVEVDGERAKLVRWAFQVFAWGTGLPASSTRNLSPVA